MENLWEMIAKARGVELGEEFILVDRGLEYKHRITTNGLQVSRHEGWFCSYDVDAFIRGEGEIEKIPFRPQIGDDYYTIINKGEVIISLWEDRSVDYTRLIAGVVFRTREEAEAYIPTWLDRISKL